MRVRWSWIGRWRIGRHWDIFLLILLVDNRLEFLEDAVSKQRQLMRSRMRFVSYVICFVITHGMGRGKGHGTR